MTSVLAAQPAEVKTALPISRTKPIMPTIQDAAPAHIKQEDPERGRPRSRSDDKDSNSGDPNDLDGDGANSSNSDGPARKRRRSRKGLDKKFECPHDGCGKSYSRAEHLYRHQLNHTPKQIYKCDYPGCARTFVRLDLCNRHRDRHTAKGSALNRKDSMMSHGSPISESRPPFAAPGSVSPETNRPGTGYNNKMGPGHMAYHSPKGMGGSPYTPVTNTPPTGYPNGGHHQNGVDYGHHDAAYCGTRSAPYHSPDGAPRPSAAYGVISPISAQHGYHTQNPNTPQSSVYVPPQNFPPFTLPPSDFAPTSATTVPRDVGPSYAPPTSSEYVDHSHGQGGSEMMMLDQMSMPGTMPMFGTDNVLQKSPYVGMPEDFMAYLFNSQQGDGSQMGPMVSQETFNYGEFGNQYSVPYYGTEPAQMGYFPTGGPQQVMSVNSLLDQNLPESSISEEKSQELFEFIKDRFREKRGSPVEHQKEAIIEGDRSDENHVLSKKMMQAYIVSYWLHFSDQVPILHKPTFSADRTPNLLLIAMMTIGAACLDKEHGQKMVKAGADLSSFLARDLRWEVFMDTNFRPPAKLWVFQALLLLELYEKMYSTRELHERAHIHHATTITLMRRGRSLLGKSALDSPPNPRGDKDNSSRQSSTSGLAHTADEWWNHWITNEATRRTAFAAFVIDSIHATMFGHSTVMVAHEMRLPLPCDEKLWKATSGSEVGRIEANLMSNSMKPISFLEGLKRTLSGQEVQTNSFGRTILMAGLLSVSWHMNQRDLQVNSLGGGVSQALGGRDKWRSTLTHAFDSWKRDFDKSLARNGGDFGGSGSGSGGGSVVHDPYSQSLDAASGGAGGSGSSQSDPNVVFESRIVLHHLAHMAMHVDIVDCQIFARAKRLLGRAIGAQDLNSAQRRMKDHWAPSAKARDAAYYALKFLCSVLMPGGHGAAGHSAANGFHRPRDPYSARDDVLLNRPWVLYFAALVVWCYGYALEGPCPDAVLPSTLAEKTQRMREYLGHYGSMKSPDDLKVEKGINNNSALLMVLKDTFEDTRWELLHEGAQLLSNCLQLNMGTTTLG